MIASALNTQTWPLMSEILLFCAALVLLYVVRRLLLPKPIAGIPYHEYAAHRLLGDAPEMLAYMQKHGEVFAWLAQQNRTLESPVVQVFTRPFSKPWVILGDYRESYNVLNRRTKEFDKSSISADIFAGVLPEHHVHFMSDRPEFKRNRSLITNLMTTKFLHDVEAVQVYVSTNALIKLWSAKMRLARGRPFEANLDIFYGTLDASFGSTFGLEERDGAIYAQLALLESCADSFKFDRDHDSPVTFPKASLPPGLASILTLTALIDIIIKSPFPGLAHCIFSKLPRFRKAQSAKRELISQEIEKAKARLNAEEPQMSSAIDDILHREQRAAKSEGREPAYNSQHIQDEIFGLMVAGHDPTASTLTWGLKYLSDNSGTQTRLREDLRAAYSLATKQGRNPTVSEITDTPVPYLDACLEEILRMSVVGAGVVRKALVDTELLGYRIPKGTPIFCLPNGPGILSPPFKIDGNRRHESALRNKGPRVGEWPVDDMTCFKPERWLVKNVDNDGEHSWAFDSLAGPMMSFGSGPRACYGRRLAYVEMRIIVVMLVWNFILQGCPEKLSSYKANELLTKRPEQCFVRLAPAGR